MKNEEIKNKAKLIRLLQHTYSSELAIAKAYDGHWKSVKDINEKKLIIKIEDEELLHRERLGQILKKLGSKPSKIKELSMSILGTLLACIYRISGWLLPMYFATRVEEKSVSEFYKAAIYANEAGMEDLEREFQEMAETQKKHEKFFKGRICAYLGLNK